MFANVLLMAGNKLAALEGAVKGVMCGNICVANVLLLCCYCVANVFNGRASRSQGRHVR